MIEQLSKDLPRRRLMAGECLFRQGDPAAAIFRIESGRLRLVRHLADGAAVAVVVVAVPKPLLLQRLAADPAAALDLAAYLARQVRELRWRLELRNVRSASERLLTVARLPRRHGRPSPSPSPLRHPVRGGDFPFDTPGAPRRTRLY